MEMHDGSRVNRRSVVHFHWGVEMELPKSGIFTYTNCFYTNDRAGGMRGQEGCHVLPLVRRVATHYLWGPLGMDGWSWVGRELPLATASIFF